MHCVVILSELTESMMQSVWTNELCIIESILLFTA